MLTPDHSKQAWVLITLCSQKHKSYCVKYFFFHNPYKFRRWDWGRWLSFTCSNFSKLCSESLEGSCAQTPIQSFQSSAFGRFFLLFCDNTNCTSFSMNCISVHWAFIQKWWILEHIHSPSPGLLSPPLYFLLLCLRTINLWRPGTVVVMYNFELYLQS